MVTFVLTANFMSYKLLFDSLYHVGACKSIVFF